MFMLKLFRLEEGRRPPRWVWRRWWRLSDLKDGILEVKAKEGLFVQRQRPEPFCGVQPGLAQLLLS